MKKILPGFYFSKNSLFMPHCILEYSNNISEEPNHSSILRQIHNALFSTGLFDLNDIKSRIIVHNDFYIGDGNAERAFATLAVEILSGKDEDTKKRIAEDCLKVLESNFQNSIKSLKFSLTVQIREIDKPSYSRIKTY
jgi:5-carboxymethyl-2-hydroxymuconate isomerase